MDKDVNAVVVLVFGHFGESENRGEKFCVHYDLTRYWIRYFMCIKYKVSKNRIESCIDRKAADLCLAWKSSTMLESASWSEYIMIIIIYDDDSPEIYFTD